VTFASLQALVSEFSSDPEVAAGLNDKLAAAAKAKDAKTRGKVLGAFELQLTRAPNAFTEEEAEVLLRLAQALRAAQASTRRSAEGVWPVSLRMTRQRWL
jgi:hypothetical protein